MVGWSGNINECSLTIDKKVQDVKISIVSLLKLPTEIGNVGFLRYATATLGRGSLTSVCFDFIENSNGVNISSEPSIYGTEKILLNSYPYKLLEKTPEIRISSNHSFFCRFLEPESFKLHNNQAKILNFMKLNLSNNFDMYSYYLENRNYVKNDNRKVFGAVPMMFLAEKYGVNVDINIGDNYQYFSSNFTTLENKLSKLGNK
jgi:hypothetical protein